MNSLDYEVLNRRDCGDGTTIDQVRFKKPIAIRDLINYALSRHRDWGYIEINGEKSFEYRYGSVLTDNITEDQRATTITEMLWYGGYTRSDFIIKLKESGCVCGDNRYEVVDRARKDILSKTNISSNQDELKVLDSFLFRCWQMGWLQGYEPICVNKKNEKKEVVSHKTFIKKRFLSWDEAGEVATALVEPDGDWFTAAINCMRDGSMGERGEDGVYDRLWWGDGIKNGPARNIRPATLTEVKKWLAHTSPGDTEYDGNGCPYIVIFGEESYVLYEVEP